MKYFIITVNHFPAAFHLYIYPGILDFHRDSPLKYIPPTTMQIVFTFANIFLGKKNFNHADCAYRRILTKQFVDKLPTNGRKEQTTSKPFITS